MINSIRYFEEECISKFEKLEDEFMKNPKNLAEYVYGLTDELHKLGLEMIRESLETMDMMLQKSPIRRKNWVVEAHDVKQLTTSLGDVRFSKTLFTKKETGHSEYLLDRILGIDPNERITEDAEARLLEEAVQTSYRRGGKECSLSSEVSKQTVKNKIHRLEFPKDVEKPKKKKAVDYLYIDADEDHVSLQFRNEKGDLTENENHQKNNCLITKLAYIYEGIENESPKSKRHRLVNPYYFCGVNAGEENLKFWDEIYEYIDNHYELGKVKKIYLNSDGGGWIKAGMKRISGITHVLDEFHLEKYLTKLTSHMNRVKFETRSEYAIEYLEDIMAHYVDLTGLNPEAAVRGRGHRKTTEQRLYDRLCEYTQKLKRYAEHIRICGDERNSYSKTDNDATFMRMKKDYMGNDQLLPGYNIQLGVCDEYIAVFDVKKYATDMNCFQPLVEKFHQTYGRYPEYPVADAGYGSFNNYLYCEEHGMKKYMKFTMFEKESKDEKYREDPYRAVNFPINENGSPICPNGKEFHYLCARPVRGNKYGRTEELYQCEDCSGCPHKEKCCKSKGNRTIRLNQELTSFHEEVLNNLNCIHGALLRMNRSIQAEGAYGSIKWNRAYTRARRRGLKGLILEISMISCGFNLHKFHLKKASSALAA